jgi:anaerobic selenocysteine-containing dehydrogenase
MRRYAAFEVKRGGDPPFVVPLDRDGTSVDRQGRILRDGEAIGILVDGKAKAGFSTPSRRLEFFSPTLRDWGWPEKQHVLPWPLKSHVHPDAIDRQAGEMLLLPNFRLPTLVHTRSANAKWLYELSHKNPVWMHPSDARRIGVKSGDLIRVTTEIGHFVDCIWVTEGIKPGVIAMSHHLGRWRLAEDMGVNRGASNVVDLSEDEKGGRRLSVIHGATAWESADPDTSRIWWEDVGVHQNLTHPVQPDPISGHHCWLQKAYRVEKAHHDDRHGDVFVDTGASMEAYRRWRSLTRSAAEFSPDGTRRPQWLKRPLKPVSSAYRLPDGPAGPS